MTTILPTDSVYIHYNSHICLVIYQLCVYMTTILPTVYMCFFKVWAKPCFGGLVATYVSAKEWLFAQAALCRGSWQSWESWDGPVIAETSWIIPLSTSTT